MIPLASCLFVVFCLEVAAFRWMCYVQAGWSNLTVKANPFDNPGLGGSHSAPVQTQGRTEDVRVVQGPAAGSLFKESAAVTSTRVLQLSENSLPAPQQEPECCLSFCLVGFFSLNKWAFANWGMKCRCDAPQPLPWVVPLLPIPPKLPVDNLPHNEKQLVQLNPLSAWIKVTEACLLTLSWSKTCRSSKTSSTTETGKKH